jgi:hypothetical protein
LAAPPVHAGELNFINRAKENGLLSKKPAEADSTSAPLW